MCKEDKIDKTLSEQILEKTIEELRESDLFSEKLLTQLTQIDLTNKASVKAALTLSKDEEE